MKPIIKYRADDGSEHDNEAQAIERDKLCAEVAEVMGLLPAKPNDTGCRFANGHGYIQHDPATALRVRHAILTIAARLCNHELIAQAIADPVGVHASWPGRIISESCPHPVWVAWERFSCMDAQWREWGQPYYANNTPTDPERLRQINA
jgi:hypothetical protein